LESSGGHGGDRALGERLGVQLQETRLAEKLTVEEMLRVFGSFYRRGRGVDKVIRAVALEEKRGAW
jgi:ABC-2 type transport system ATP-binding protein